MPEVGYCATQPTDLRMCLITLGSCHLRVRAFCCSCNCSMRTSCLLLQLLVRRRTFDPALCRPLFHHFQLFTPRTHRVPMRPSNSMTSSVDVEQSSIRQQNKDHVYSMYTASRAEQLQGCFTPRPARGRCSPSVHQCPRADVSRC